MARSTVSIDPSTCARDAHPLGEDVAGHRAALAEDQGRAAHVADHAALDMEIDLGLDIAGDQDVRADHGDVIVGDGRASLAGAASIRRIVVHPPLAPAMRARRISLEVGRVELIANIPPQTQLAGLVVTIGVTTVKAAFSLINNMIEYGTIQVKRLSVSPRSGGRKEGPAVAGEALVECKRRPDYGVRLTSVVSHRLMPRQSPVSPSS